MTPGQHPPDRERGARVRRDIRSEAIFDHWCGHRVLKHSGLSLRQFTMRCDAAEVPGLGPEDFYAEQQQDPGSDTVDGSTTQQRDDAAVAGTRTTNPGNADRATWPAGAPATGAASGPPSHQELPGSEPPF